MLDLYRDWLAKNRARNNSHWFRTYDRLANGLAVRLQPSRRHSRNVDTAPPPAPAPKPKPVPATRYRDTTNWAPVFERLNQGIRAHGTPRISVLTPAWNTREHWFAEAAISLLDQTFTNWEWIVVDDASPKHEYKNVAKDLIRSCPRFRFIVSPQNQGISGATNTALQQARGEYVCMLDHDDILHPEALALCVEALEDQNLDAVYTDSNKVDEIGYPLDPFYKPGWSPEYFRGVMYIGHLLCVRRDHALALNGFDKAFDGVQDFEFFLRYSEKHPKIGHIPRILYHWRTAEGSIAAASAAKGDRIGDLQCLAVQQHLDRLNLPATAKPGRSPHRVTIAPKPRTTHPRVSVVIPTRDSAAVLTKCLDTLQNITAYPNLQIVCADHETTDPKALARMNHPGIDRVVCRGDFNYARINNEAIRAAADGEYLILLNNDIEIIDPHWIDHMLYYAEQPDIGAVGALLLYPNGKVQHAGVCLGFRGTADHIMRDFDPTWDGYAGSLACAREVSAVTAACLMVKRSLYDQVGGLNELYRTLYQDVDFCLRLQSAGHRNIFVPSARLYHHESYTRKTDYDLLDRALMIDTWDTAIAADPFFNPNFCRNAVDYQPAPTADRGDTKVLLL
ncbi:hypothetical protein F183_A02410 [Bryobacterales bacterium F-183]|nr:hypothetical protein F183_A02410 [Bryobacterales bacterium F-183]